MDVIVPKIIEKELIRFEEEFKHAIKSESSLINSVASYLLKTKGKRLRPVLSILSAGAVGGITDATLRGAVLVELLHTATLVHDDVVDNAAMRRHLFSVNALWDNKVCVLIGDFLLSKGLSLSLKSKDFNFLERITEAVEKISESEIIQLDMSRSLSVTEEVYYKIIEGKTASLFVSACAIGATSSTCMAKSHIEHLKSYGLALGIAFQIKDDILDYIGSSGGTGKEIGVDIKQGKITLPLIRALSNSSSQTKKEILKLMQNPEKKENTVDYIAAFVKEKDGISYAIDVGKKYCDQANNFISKISLNDYSHALSNLAGNLFDI